MSWVTLDDTIAVLRYALENAAVSGAVNVVSPQPVRNEKFAQELGRAMHRPAMLPTPAFALRMALGQEAADTMLLGSERVMPKRLQGFGYEFRHADLRLALEDVLYGNGK
jgi:uncharacterized protein